MTHRILNGSGALFRVLLIGRHSFLVEMRRRRALALRISEISSAHNRMIFLFRQIAASSGQYSRRVIGELSAEEALYASKMSRISLSHESMAKHISSGNNALNVLKSY